MKTNKFVAFIAVLLVTLSFAVMVCSAAPADTDEYWRVLYVNAEGNRITIQFANPTSAVSRWDIKNYVKLFKGETEIKDFTHKWDHMDGMKDKDGNRLGSYNHIAVIDLKEDLAYDTVYTLKLLEGYGAENEMLRRTTDYIVKFKVIKLFEDDFEQSPIIKDTSCKWVRFAAIKDSTKVYDSKEKTARPYNMFPNVEGIGDWSDYTISYTGISGDPKNTDTNTYLSREMVQIYNTNKAGFNRRYNGLAAHTGAAPGGAQVTNIGCSITFNSAFNNSIYAYSNSSGSLIGSTVSTNGYKTLYESMFDSPSEINKEFPVKIEANNNYIRVSKNNKIAGVIYSGTYTDGAPFFKFDLNNGTRMKDILITKIEFIEEEIPEELKISSVKTTDGTAITNSISGDIRGEVSVLNSFKTEKPIKVVVAAYETDGESLRFLDAQICTPTSAAASTETKVPFNIGTVSGADTVKIFVWDTLESLKAYESCKTYTYTPEPANQ